MDAHPLYVRVKHIRLVEVVGTLASRRSKPKPCDIAHIVHGSERKMTTKEQLFERF